jgi:YD repeat-containing protein
VLVRDRASTGLGSYRVALQDDTNVCKADDTEAPALTLLDPTGGEVIAGAASFQVQWLSDDNVSVASHQVALSTDGGATFAAPIAANLSGNAQSFIWAVPPDIAPTRTAVIRVTASDAAGNVQTAASGPLSIIGSGFAPNSTTTYEYDGLNRVVGVTFASGLKITYNWDAAGNLIGIAAR